MRFIPKWVIAVYLCFSVTPIAFSFVLLDGLQKPVLPVSEDNPVITFHWDGKAPGLKDKDKVLEGNYAFASDAELMGALIDNALATWSNVSGSYLRLESELDINADVEKEDRLFSLVVKSESNISTAAGAIPTIEEGVIVDCDIKIASRSTGAKELAYTLIHELGHCLGLGHAHSNYNAIMGYSRSRRDLSLGNDDKAGLIFLYPDSYYDSEVKELVSCGVIKHDSAKVPPPNQFFAGFLLLGLLFPAVFYIKNPKAKNCSRAIP